jgi:hypothetical protein
VIKYFFRGILALALALAFALAGGCASRPQTLLQAPKPGIIGQPRFTTDDNSTTERVTFRTRIAEPQVRVAFSQFCERRRMKLDSRAGTTGIQWWKSDRDYLGILVSPDAGHQTLAVTYFYNR